MCRPNNPAVAVIVNGGALQNSSGDTVMLGLLTLNGATMTDNGTGSNTFNSWVFNNTVTVFGNRTIVNHWHGAKRNNGIHLSTNAIRI